jgi:hypothetical protein
MADDPFQVLGVSPDADLADVRTARNLLAKRLHPDHGGDGEGMQALNAAFEAAVLLVQSRVDSDDQSEDTAEASSPPPPPSEPDTGVRRVGRWAAEEQASFVVHALPVVAFDALLTASGWLGELVDDDPPYVLEVYLHEPVECFCRLDLVPDAGASTVSVTLAYIEGAAWPPPTLDEVRDAWIDALNRPNG